jgi:hypothetical protein
MNLNLTIDRFEEDKAVLKTSDNKSIVWPKDKLPQSAQEGSVLSFVISGNAAADADSQELAKNILNEILNPDDSA